MNKDYLTNTKMKFFISLRDSVSTIPTQKNKLNAYGLELQGSYLNILSVIILFFCAFQIQAQHTVKHDMQQIHDNYLQLGNVMVNIDYNMYASDSASNILETKRARVYKNDDYQVLDFMGSQTWYLQDQTIVIMQSDKKIVLGEPISQIHSTSLAGISLDTLLQVYQVIQREVGGKIIYHLEIPDYTYTPYSSMDIIAGDNGLYEKIILHSQFPLSYYGKCSECEDSFPRIEITFNYVDKGFIMPDSEPLLACITTENNQFSLSGKYINYRLVNLKYKN